MGSHGMEKCIKMGNINKHDLLDNNLSNVGSNPLPSEHRGKITSRPCQGKKVGHTA